MKANLFAFFAAAATAICWSIVFFRLGATYAVPAPPVVKFVYPAPVLQHGWWMWRCEYTGRDMNADYGKCVPVESPDLWIPTSDVCPF